MGAAQGPERAQSTVCPACGGTGWKQIPPAEGKKTPQVVRCDCRLGMRTDLLLSRARIPARYEHCSLSDFHADFAGANKTLHSARLAAGRFVEEYPLERTGLMFIGPIGVGKTHLAVGVIRELAHKGIPTLFYDYRELLKEIQNSYNPQVNTTELAILKPIFETEVLVLDELGAVKPTEWVWDTVSHILNTRYNTKRTTIITTNYVDRPPAGAEFEGNSNLSAAKRVMRDETLGDRIGERMRSRLHEMCRIVTMDGVDFRQKVQSANFR
jgi:DNA replication protein DnaC